MKHIYLMVFIVACLLSGTALADVDCTDPVSDWQPKEKLHEMMSAIGWNVTRIKIDDGCYEVKAIDRKGHRVEATFAPATLTLLELEVKFVGTGDTSDYIQLPSQAELQPSEPTVINQGEPGR
ncbi:PepSY domain-containing protein [Aliidiomarina quisquiliarum]|uniref:PepSY domain-containing protein n=1 Tax=Aliidiomarina quisquiliarum TaxID=2938947 RepID=UPI00208FEFAB|nr:PepSY domain-containing protein [Aliidiomarina quisquiliarum]MCO4321790.1 PepSY domain-containing protein [Aliidiomarina quisquiliarum]